MSAMRTNAAAVMLGVSPNTLRSWERRFGFPTPRRTPGGHRQYDLVEVEVEALRQAFEETQNISSAVSIARERGEGPSTCARLRAAFARFDEEQADRLLEDSLALRSVERTVEELLLPAVESLRGEEPAGPGFTSPGGVPPAGLRPPSGSRRRRRARRASSWSMPRKPTTPTRSTSRPSSWRFGAEGCEH